MNQIAIALPPVSLTKTMVAAPDENTPAKPVEGKIRKIISSARKQETFFPMQKEKRALIKQVKNSRTAHLINLCLKISLDTSLRKKVVLCPIQRSTNQLKLK